MKYFFKLYLNLPILYNKYVFGNNNINSHMMFAIIICLIIPLAYRI